MRISLLSLKVLGILSKQTEECSGADITRSFKIKSGTLYPLLNKLEEHGWIKRRWENVNPTEAGRPARRLIKLTKEGKKKIQSELEIFN